MWNRYLKRYQALTAAHHLIKTIATASVASYKVQEKTLLSSVMRRSISLLVCFTLVLVTWAERSPKRRHACICPRIYWPVCGTDGRSYSNECMMRCASSKGETRSDVKVAREGLCEEKIPRIKENVVVNNPKLKLFNDV